MHHISGGIADETHGRAIRRICEPLTPGRTALCYIAEAIAVAERENFPKVGLSVTRRVLRGLCQRYCDSKIYSAACFICSQIRTSVQGYKGIDLTKAPEVDNPKLRPCSELKWLGADDLRAIEQQSPGTLWNNAGYTLWRERYVERTGASKDDKQPNPLREARNQWCAEPVNWCAPAEVPSPNRQHISDWSVIITISRTTVCWLCR